MSATLDFTKYEGHTPGGWKWAHCANLFHGADWPVTPGNIALIADAPLLLAAAKRMQEALLSIKQGAEIVQFDTHKAVIGIVDAALKGNADCDDDPGDD